MEATNDSTAENLSDFMRQARLKSTRRAIFITVDTPYGQFSFYHTASHAGTEQGAEEFLRECLDIQRKFSMKIGELTETACPKKQI